MANAELIEYAKNQLKAGSSANYIRTVLIKQGWGERDVDDALGIAQSESPAAPPAAKPAAPAKHPTPGRNKFLFLAEIVTGLFFLIAAASSIMGEMALLEFAFNALPWAAAVLELLAGIFWIILGIKEFRK